MFSSRLRSLRIKRGYTQKRMSEMLSVSLNAYQKYEQAERLPTLKTLVRLADILECPTDFLLGRDAFLCSLGVCVDEYL